VPGDVCDHEPAVFGVVEAISVLTGPLAADRSTHRPIRGRLVVWRS
jgi:hypothetical protein